MMGLKNVEENVALFFDPKISTEVRLSIHGHLKCKKVVQVCSHAILEAFSQPAIAHLSLHPSLCSVLI